MRNTPSEEHFHAARPTLSTSKDMTAAAPGTLIAATFLAPVALLTLSAVLSQTAGIPVGALTRDRVHFEGGPFYTGAYSNLGLLLWACTVTVCVMSARLLPRQRRSERRMLLCAAALSFLLLVDDMLMLHEVVFPEFLGIADMVVMGTLGLLGLAFFACFWREIFRRLGGLMVATMTFFALSLGLDVAQTDPPRYGHYLLEDGFKIMGIFGWLSYWARRAAGAVREEMAPAPAVVVAGAASPLAAMSLRG